ncbi:MAG: hypothetical protein ACKPKO_61230, partial [Candidatus Fonsibacter sp.]
DARLVYIRYHAQTETKPNSQNNIGSSRPAFSNITKQIDYESGSGDYYSLILGREFKPGRWSVLLDFDNKSDEASHSGLGLAKNMNMDKHDAPQAEDSLRGSPLHLLRRRAT